MSNRFGATIVALAVCACNAGTLHAQAQVRDSSPTFSIFGGTALQTANDRTSTGFSNLEFGGTGDFRVSRLPVPLRATLAFRRETQPWTFSPMKFGTLSLDAVGKPIPRIFGIQPYLLGGLGVATRSQYAVVSTIMDENGATSARLINIPRSNWAFVEGGVGLELGRHFFIQTKIMAPVASQGPVLMPVSVGFRFWD